MGAVGQWRVALQERPEYQAGRAAHDRREPRDWGNRIGEAREAWVLGWDDARLDATERTP